MSAEEQAKQPTKRKKEPKVSEKAPETKIINSINDLEQVILLAKKHQIDLLEVEGHKIVISRHPIQEMPVNKDHPDYGKTQEELDEELLYYSSNG